MASSAEKEQSKDYILERVKFSTIELGASVVATINGLTTLIAIITIVVMIVLIFLILTAFTYFQIISADKALLVFVVAVISLLILGFVFVCFSTIYTRRRISNVVAIYNNFLSSEAFLLLINGAAQAYIDTPPA